jgi:hypothetical protein
MDSLTGYRFIMSTTRPIDSPARSGMIIGLGDAAVDTGVTRTPRDPPGASIAPGFPAFPGSASTMGSVGWMPR